MTWLNNLGDFPDRNVYIYNKLKGSTYAKSRFRNEFLENIGKCDHTYLAHVIKNYDRLAEFTLFITPHYDEHVISEQRNESVLNFFSKCNQARDYVDANEYFSLACNNYICKNFRLAHWDSRLKPNKDNLTFGDWMLKNVEPKFENYVRRHGLYYTFGGTFCVEKKYILSRPLSFYVKLMEQFDVNDSEVAHFFERAWFYIFNLHKIDKLAST